MAKELLIKSNAKLAESKKIEGYATNIEVSGKQDVIDSINLIKVDGSFSEDFAIFDLSQIVFPLDKQSLATYIKSLSEPYKTYLTQLSQVHPLNDWKGTSAELLAHLQKSSYNYVVARNGSVGVVVGFINKDTMSVINPNAIACIRIAELDLNNYMKKFGEIYGVYDSGDQLSLYLPNNNFVLRDHNGKSIEIVSDEGTINIESKNSEDHNTTQLRLGQDSASITTYNDSKPIIFRGSDIRIDGDYIPSGERSVVTKKYADTKQDKLTAGSNISIDDNVISASFGSIDTLTLGKEASSEGKLILNNPWDEPTIFNSEGISLSDGTYLSFPKPGKTVTLTAGVYNHHIEFIDDNNNTYEMDVINTSNAAFESALEFSQKAVRTAKPCLNTNDTYFSPAVVWNIDYVNSAVCLLSNTAEVYSVVEVIRDTVTEL